METINYSAFRTRLTSVLDKVNQDQKPLLITRQNGKPAVLMSLDEFHAYRETARLAESIAQIDAGEIVEKGLLEE